MSGTPKNEYPLTNAAPIALGTLHLSLHDRPTFAHAISLVHRALDLGVRFIDTADSYCVDDSDFGHNERLICRALKDYGKVPDNLIVATKGGLTRPGGRWEVNGDPEYLAKAIQNSFDALGGQKPIDLWQLHAVDRRYPITATADLLADACERGLIRYVGLSNATLDDLQIFRKYLQIVSVQNQYNVWFRHAEADGLLDYCRNHGIHFLSWSPLGGPQRIGELTRSSLLNDLAQQYGSSIPGILFAWMLQKRKDIIPIAGTKSISHLEELWNCIKLALDPIDFWRIEAWRPRRPNQEWPVSDFYN